MSNGFSNFQIDEAFKNIGDEDIENNFVGVFPLNHMNHKLMICEKKENMFVIANTDSSEYIGGSYLTFNLKLTFFSLILLYSMA